jgi:tRNA (cmo5U34)-methyltransferase
VVHAPKIAAGQKNRKIGRSKRNARSAAGGSPWLTSNVMTHPAMFDESHAATYDDRFAKLAPFRDALHLVTQFALAELPADARILCVGAGTGAELLHLAAAFPGWRFTAVDPSGPMLRRCRARVEAAGFGGRCQFHEGFVENLADQGPFDGATALLVSQFLVDRDARCGFFRAIADRLRPSAPLVVADLAWPPTQEELMAVWQRAWLHAGIPPEQVARLRESLGRDVAVLAPEEVAAIVTAGGFDAPMRCFQTVLIHGWVTRRGT